MWRQHWVHTYIGSQKQPNTLNTMLFPNSGWKHIHKKDAWLSQSHSARKGHWPAKIQTLPKTARVPDNNIWQQQRHPSTTLLFWLTLNGHFRYAHYWLNNKVRIKLSCLCCWCLNYYYVFMIVIDLYLVKLINFNGSSPILTCNSRFWPSSGKIKKEKMPILVHSSLGSIEVSRNS